VRLEHQVKMAKKAPLPGPAETPGRWSENRAKLRKRRESLGKELGDMVTAEARAEKAEREKKMAEMRVEEMEGEAKNLMKVYEEELKVKDAEIVRLRNQTEEDGESIAILYEVSRFSLLRGRQVPEAACEGEHE